MPLYEYNCPECGAKFEILTSIEQRNNQVCEECGGHMNLIPSAPAKPKPLKIH